LILRYVAQILLKQKRINNLISAIDQGVDGWGGAGEVAARLGCGSGSLEPGIAHATGHHF
jgi:hypothetical protein